VDSGGYVENLKFAGLADINRPELKMDSVEERENVDYHDG